MTIDSDATHAASVRRPLLEVRELSVRYGAISAVDSVSLDVLPGQIVAVLGANGAGKSSLLNAIVGLVPAASGSVVFGGQAIHGLPPEAIVRKGLTLTPEGRRVFSGLSVADNLRIGGAIRKDRSALAATRRSIFDLFPRLEERLTQTAGTLSGGEQQMLSIGRALMAAPQLLLLDEPSLGLAPVIVDELFLLLERLRDQGTTLLLVEQNAQRALEIAEYAYVLSSGQITAQGPGAELLSSMALEEAYLGSDVN